VKFEAKNDLFKVGV